MTYTPNRLFVPGHHQPGQVESALRDLAYVFHLTRQVKRAFLIERKTILKGSRSEGAK